MSVEKDETLAAACADNRYSYNLRGEVSGPRGGILKPRLLGSGDTPHFRYYYKKKYRFVSIPRYVCAKHFGLPKDPSQQVNHKNGVRLDNRPSNLEWCTKSENQRHRYRVLKHPPVVGNKKINYEVASSIREKFRSGQSVNSLAREYALSKSTISYVVNNKTWKPLANKEAVTLQKIKDVVSQLVREGELTEKGYEQISLHLSNGNVAE